MKTKASQILVKLANSKKVAAIVSAGVMAMSFSASAEAAQTLGQMVQAAGNDAKLAVTGIVAIFSVIGLFIFLASALKARLMFDPAMQNQVNKVAVVAGLIIGGIMATGGVWLIANILGSLGAAATAPNVAPQL